jgi:glycosyltransferase involved in cell wall biosynthesis
LNWVLITGAYPPDQGGLADYTAVLARELARQGDQVTVVTGPSPACEAPPGIRLVTLADHFGRRGLSELTAVLAGIPEPRRLFVQYVPQALGPRRDSRFKGLPLTFAWWLRTRPHGWPVWTMFHEATVTAPAGSGLSRKLLSRVAGQMLRWTVRASSRVFVAMQAWQPYVERYLSGQTLEYLPIPSNIATSVQEDDRSRTRSALLNGHARQMVGHFGTFSSEVTCLLEPLIRRSLAEHRDRQIVLVGDGSQEFARLLGPDARTLVSATGRLEADAVARHLSACDLMIQPFPDGASTRRGSIMAGLALGVPVVSNWGEASEAIWKEQRALALAPDPASLPAVVDELLARPDECRALGERGRNLYEEKFSLAHTARVLRV